MLIERAKHEQFWRAHTEDRVVEVARRIAARHPEFGELALALEALDEAVTPSAQSEGRSG